MKTETRVEKHNLNGNAVWVKRDDLFLEDCQPDCPPLAKLRGAFPLLRDMQKYDGVKSVAVFDTRISKAGQGIAFICKELGLKCLVGFPMLKGGEPSPSQKIAAKLGAELFPIPAGRTAVCYGIFSKEARRRNYTLMPLGLVCKDTVEAVALEAKRTIEELLKGGVKIETIVLSTGTGTIATGIHLGADAKVIGVSCGMATHKQISRMKVMAFPEVLNWNFLQLIEPEWEYYDALDTSKCPFRTNPWYDMKAWEWLCQNFGELKQPVMFWNIGA